MVSLYFFFFSSRRRHTRWPRDWSSDVCSSDLFQHDIHDLVIRRHEGHIQEEVGLGGVVVYLVNQISKHWRHLRAWREIGRASCRERVETSVVRGGAGRIM